jgi:hypothetical protein
MESNITCKGVLEAPVEEKKQGAYNGDLGLEEGQRRWGSRQCCGGEQRGRWKKSNNSARMESSGVGGGGDEEQRGQASDDSMIVLGGVIDTFVGRQ